MFRLLYRYKRQLCENLMGETEGLQHLQMHFTRLCKLYITPSVEHICKYKMYNQELVFIISVIVRCKYLRTVIGF
jgi:hypothetical protein